MTILARSRFETGQLFEGGTGEDHWGWEFLTGMNPPAMSVVQSPAPRNGNYCLRSYWLWGWPWFGNTKLRSEIKRPNNMAYFSAGNVYWGGYSVYMEDNANNRAAVAANRFNQSVTQIHQFNGTSTSQLMAKNNQWNFNCPRNSARNIGPVELGRWNDFVFWWKCETNNTGAFKLWLNASTDAEDPVYEVSNVPTNWDTLSYFKAGIYREKYQPAGVTYFEQFYDEFRFGDGSESFATVKPAGTVPVIEDITTVVEGLILDGEKGVRLDLSGYGLSATGKKVWIGQGSVLVEQEITAEDATSVTFDVDYQGRLTGGDAKVYIGDPV